MGKDVYSLNVYINASTTSHGMREEEGKTDTLCLIRAPRNVKSGASLTCTVTWDEMCECVMYIL